MLVHVTYHSISVSYLRDEALRPTGVPVFNLTHGTFGVIRCGGKMQETEHAVGVRGIGDEGRTISRGVFTYKEIGTSL